jgi:hypothetical protein
MPKSNEFTIQLENKPGSFGKFSRALAERGVNVIAFEAFPREGQSSSTVRLVVDNPTNTKAVLNSQHVNYKEAEVAQIKLPHRPGELARATSALGEENINIEYAYCGTEPGTNAPLLFFGVSDVRRAVTVLDEAMKKAA